MNWRVCAWTTKDDSHHISVVLVSHWSRTCQPPAPSATATARWPSPWTQSRWRGSHFQHLIFEIIFTEAWESGHTWAFPHSGDQHSEPSCAQPGSSSSSPSRSASWLLSCSHSVRQTRAHEAPKHIFIPVILTPKSHDFGLSSMWG